MQTPNLKVENYNYSLKELKAISFNNRYVMQKYFGFLVEYLKNQEKKYLQDIQSKTLHNVKLK